MLRHTHSIGNEKQIIDSTDSKFDLGLSKKGKQQAKELVPKLRGHNFDVFIISSLKKTIETIKPFLETQSDPKIITKELTLERNTWEFIGKPKGAINKFCEKHKIKDRISFNPQGGESILEVYKRAKQFLQFLKVKFTN